MHGENIAAKRLRRLGYKILKRNVRFKRYEIDIIAKEGDTTVFVEVKTRRDDSFASPEENVDATKRRHIRAAAHQFIAQQDDPDMYYRFDLVTVLAPEKGKPTVTLYRDAFPDE